jgi:hypothetical protein
VCVCTSQVLSSKNQKYTPKIGTQYISANILPHLPHPPIPGTLLHDIRTHLFLLRYLLLWAEVAAVRNDGKMDAAVACRSTEEEACAVVRVPTIPPREVVLRVEEVLRVEGAVRRSTHTEGVEDNGDAILPWRGCRVPAVANVVAADVVVAVVAWAWYPFAASFGLGPLRLE